MSLRVIRLMNQGKRIIEVELTSRSSSDYKDHIRVLLLFILYHNYRFGGST